MYPANGAVFRADLAGLVMESGTWEAGLIGGRVSPFIDVTAKDGQYPKFKLGTGNLLKRQENIQRAPGSGYARGSLAYEQDTYATKEYGFELPLDYVNREDASRFFDAALVTSKQAKRIPLMEHEIRVAAMTFNTGNYAANNSGTAYTIANIATFDVGLDVDAAKGVLLGKGESDQQLSVVMSHDVFVRIRASTKLQNRLRGIGVSSDTILNVDEQAVAEALGVKEVIVGKNYFDTAIEGAAFASGAIWSNTYLWVGRLGTSGQGELSMLDGGAQYTLNWSAYGTPMNVFEYEEPQTNSTVFRAAHHVTEKVVNANAGTLVTTQYA
jgi:hypothetical protein